jgi:mannose-6-phosphate isomerase-like protein (cupin superfamily)
VLGCPGEVGTVTDLSRDSDLQRREFLLGRGQRATILTTAAESGGRFDLVEGRKEAGAMSPLHVHGRYDERFWVAAGELAVWAGDSHLVLRSGDYACVPVGVPHTFRVGAEGCHVLTISSPAGFAELVERAGTPADGADETADLDLERFRRVADELGDVILAAPGTLPGDLRPEDIDAAMASAGQVRSRLAGQ